MKGNFKLEWTDFERNLIDSFEQLRSGKDLFDVTLVCDDEEVQAHKVILAASSCFFKSIMKRNPHTNPLIYMRGVKMEDMRALLDFIYIGQTSVSQDNVKSFLKLGEELGVTGLVEEKLENKEEEGKRGQEESVFQNETLMNQIENLQRLEVKLEERSSSETEKDADDSMLILQEDPKENEHDTTEVTDIGEKLSDPLPNSSAEPISTTKRRNSLTLNSGRIFECSKCDKFYKAKQNLKRHEETHMDGLEYKCTGCEMIMKTKNALQTHMYVKCRSSKPSDQ